MTEIKSNEVIRKRIEIIIEETRKITKQNPSKTGIKKIGMIIFMLPKIIIDLFLSKD